jgi:hypothetical protein
MRDKEILTMRYFCTYFDSNYLVRALALYHSLERHCGAFRLYALCLDTNSYETVTRCRLPHLGPIALPELEKGDVPLVNCKSNRSPVEYYFTCSPCLPLFLLEKYPTIDLLTYLDADLYFFAHPEPIFDEMRGHSIGIIEHRCAPRIKYRENGKYNVGWITFRRDANGLKCLRWWKERCIEWCYERWDNGKWSDQGYLTEWPERFAGVRVIQHKGANVAPWNVANYALTCRDQRVWVDNDPLLFYHFHGFKQLLPWLYDSNLGRSGSRLTPVLRWQVYGAYIAELDRHSVHGPPTASIRNPADRYGPLLRWVRLAVRVASALTARAYIVAYPGRSPDLPSTSTLANPRQEPLLDRDIGEVDGPSVAA